MFYPERMSRITIVSPKKYIQEIVEILYELKVLHIKDHVPKDDIGIGSPLGDAEKISELILDLQSIKFNVTFPKKMEKEKISMEQMDRFLKDVKSQVSSLAIKRTNVNDGLKQLEKEKEELSFLDSAGILSLDLLNDYDNFDLHFGRVTNIEKIKNIKDTEVFYSKKVNKLYPVVVLVKKDKKTDLKMDKIILSVKGTGSVRGKLDKVNKEIKNLNEDEKKIKTELKEIAERHGNKLAYIESVLMEKIKKSEAPLKFASSDYAFLVNGWIPIKNKDALVDRVAQISKNIYVKFEDVDEKEEVPTKINNPNPIRPFEFFLNLYSLPKYNEIDPSFIMFLTFPLFYGFILGDIGYGLVLLLLGLALRMKMKHALFDIIIISSLVTIVFGFIFGEFFGAEEIFGIHLNPYLHRIQDINQLMIVSAVIGLVHLNIGYILGFVNELKHHGLKHAILGKVSWMGLQLSIILFALNLMGFASVNVYVIGAIAILSILAILKGEGMFAIVELPSILSNILSYLRLAAVGLASAALALVVNDFAGQFFAQGGIMLAAGVLTLVLGHGVNLALGILGSFLHSMRLHYVEMFTKFYQGSGKEYEPFGE